MLYNSVFSNWKLIESSLKKCVDLKILQDYYRETVENFLRKLFISDFCKC